MTPFDRSLRYRCDLAALLELPGGATAQGRMLEVSESGAFIETTADIQYGERVRLGLVLGGSPWFATTTVVRLGKSQKELHHPKVENVTVACEGVGLRFEKVPAKVLVRLRALLAQLDEQ